MACVGGGSNAIGLFYPFIKDESVKIYGVEAGGEKGLEGKHSATLTAGRRPPVRSAPGAGLAWPCSSHDGPPCGSGD